MRSLGAPSSRLMSSSIAASAGGAWAGENGTGEVRGPARCGDWDCCPAGASSAPASPPLQEQKGIRNGALTPCTALQQGCSHWATGVAADSTRKRAHHTCVPKE